MRLHAAKPKPALIPGAIYISDNGRVICLECAGAAALYGRDISGQPVQRVSQADLAEWFRMTGEKTMRCEEGCTCIELQDPRPTSAGA